MVRGSDGILTNYPSVLKAFIHLIQMDPWDNNSSQFLLEPCRYRVRRGEPEEPEPSAPARASVPPSNRLVRT